MYHRFIVALCALGTLTKGNFLSSLAHVVDCQSFDGVAGDDAETTWRPAGGA